MPLLPDYPFQHAYGPEDDRVNDFYVPALSAAVTYDRSAGFFSSTALAVAATGVARLIANGGRMRLLVGAQLSPEDVAAIEQGYDLRERIGHAIERQPLDPEDDIARARLEALAWMIQTGHLDIRVVLPVDPSGHPVPAAEAEGYYHPKTGIFTDAEGNQVAFAGSSNESMTGWQRNYEVFDVFRSWDPSVTQYIRTHAQRFERLWNGSEANWIAVPVPDAARQRLLRLAPNAAPTREPLERPHVIGDRLIAQFLRDAPHLLGGAGIGAATAAVDPWPHQRQVTRQVVDTWPSRYLLADEVGLGKTIEAGLILRQLALTGLVRRVLILVPKSVLRQWQEELYEKFALDVPAYDGTQFNHLSGAVTLPTTANPWDGVGLALASSQLMKRAVRQKELVTTHLWDLVLVDEAHHARRKDFLNLNAYRPNRLLELLKELQAHTRGLLLMTATPMQVHPIEVWDLAELLGMSGDWGASARKFLRFFDELRRGPREADWDFILRMTRAEVQAGGLDARFADRERGKLGPVGWSQLEALLKDPQPGKALARLPADVQQAAVRLAQHHTPMRRLFYRNTRDLLRRYRQQGLLDANVPTRDPKPVWIAMRPEERELYDRIEEYISDFYQKYEEQRKGLGFVMTVYRRRLTSSFFAVRRSLERRLDFLRGTAADGAAADGLGGAGLDDDDLEELDLAFDFSEDDDVGNRALFLTELAYVEDFLHQLAQLGQADSKVEQLVADLRNIFKARDTVIVFTQYADTMDHLRDELRSVYGSQVACYSGRGGERWDGMTWLQVTKEEIKNAFRQGDEVKILLCTEAASEGLNLQTCGVLINYDMPWNPMRVEQRIGRIDRIGQRYDEVRILNYFYAETIEARVYQALENRIDWFQTVVGQLQPILARVGQAIRTLAMTPREAREGVLHSELRELSTALDQQATALDIDAVAEEAILQPEPLPPLTLIELGDALLAMPGIRQRLTDHAEIPGASWLRTEGKRVAVTFDAACFDAHPNSVQLLTYGNPLLDELLNTIPKPAAAEKGPVLRLHTDHPLPRVAWYAQGADGVACCLVTLPELRAALAAPPPTQPADWPVPNVSTLRIEFATAVTREAERITAREQGLAAARRRTLQDQARDILLQAALVELAIGQQPELGATETYPIGFHNNAVLGLARHHYPFAPLLHLVGATGIEPRPTDPYFREIQSELPGRLKARWETHRDRAGELVAALTTPFAKDGPSATAPYVTASILASADHG
jgi:ERCC4-related helicase